MQKLIGRAETEVLELEAQIIARGEQAPTALLDEWASRLNWLNAVGHPVKPDRNVVQLCVRKFDLPSPWAQSDKEFDPFYVTGRLLRPMEGNC